MSFPQQSVEKPLVILGAGLTGLSLADALGERGWRAPIVLIDRRRRWDEDRTWSTWLTGPLRYAELARARWWSWRVRRDGSTAFVRTRAHPYVSLSSATLYDHVLTRLDARADVQLRTGERVLDVGADAAAPVVRTARETIEAALVVDAMGAASPLLTGIGSPAITQRFLGWEVATERPVFDPGTVTLMDFGPARRDGVDFIYRLPYSANRALVEHTSIGSGGAPEARDRRAHLRAELAAAGDYEIVREEQGVIPMTARPFPLRHGPRVLCAGGAAGAVRPSSGYAFSRIQRHVTALADALAQGRLPGSPAGDGVLPAVGPARLAAMDATFLAALRLAPDGGRSLFWALARGAPADAFARFMTDASSPWDEARVAAALPLGGVRALRGM